MAKRERRGLALVLMVMSVSFLLSMARGVFTAPQIHGIPVNTLTHEAESIAFSGKVQSTTAYVLDTMGESQWCQTGLSAKQAKILVKQLAQRAKSPEETIRNFKYAPPGWAAKQLSRLVISKVSTNQLKQNTEPTNEQGKVSKPALLDLNAADTNALIQLPGIGAYTARKIVDYRERLGGYRSIDQVLEIKSVHIDQFERFSPKLTIVTPFRWLDLLHDDMDRLGRHPYIGYRFAKLIIAYRNQHPDLTGNSWIREIKVIPDSVQQKINQYLPLQ